MRMTTAFIACLLALSTQFESALAEGKRAPTLKDRIAASELIVIGKLVDVEEHAFSLTFKYPKGEYSFSPAFFNSTPDPETRSFDRAKIKNPRVLKGNPHNSSVRIAFDSEGLGHSYTPYANHKAGEEGIWFLDQDGALTGYWFPNRRGPKDFSNPLPLAQTDEIVKILKELNEHK